jgi:hypothetical protein
MTIIKNHFEVFLVTSKKQGNGQNGIIESKVGLYSIKASSHIFVSCGQDSVSAVVRLVDKKNWDTQNFLRLYQALNCQNKVKIKLTFTITVDSYLVRYNAKSNRITKIRN